MGRLLLYCFAVGTIAITFQNCELNDGATASNSAFDDALMVNDTDLTSASLGARELAHLIYRRLATKVATNHQDLQEMEKLIRRGQRKEAALIATADHDFYNVTIRSFASKMSNREEDSAAPLNDFIATTIGIARDNHSAKELLTGNYYYSADGLANVRSDLALDIVRSNNHYQDLDDQYTDLAEVLVLKTPIQVIGNNNQLMELTDGAGVLTSRAFMSAHAIAGTNRRLVEFSFRQFLCAPIDTWSNLSYSDVFVGRDIGRTPRNEFINKCKGCHAPMDAMRPAFAHINFQEVGNDGHVEYLRSYLNDPNPNNANLINVPVPANEQLVPSKFRRGSDIFPLGYVVDNDNWQNLTADNQSFGWSSQTTGSGMQEFGAMLADSQAFSQCMVKRAFATVCYREFPAAKVDLLATLSKSFAENNFRLKDLFAEVVIQDDCLGGE